MRNRTSQATTIGLQMLGPRITSDVFCRGVRTFFEFIEDVAADVSGKRRAIEWAVSAEPGSVVVCAKAEVSQQSPALATAVVRAIADGVEAISKRTTRPEHFSDTALQKLHELGNLVGFGDSGVDHVRIRLDGRCNELSPASVAYVGELLGTPTSAYGTVEGRLLAVNVRGRLKFSVYEMLTDKAVTCFFGDKLFNDVIAAIGKRVSVYGMLRYRKNGQPANIEIEELSVFPAEHELPRFSDMIGILRD